MNKTTGNTGHEEQKTWKTRGRKALIINIIFFLLLFIGMILTPVSGFTIAAIFIIIAFVASILYIYLF